MERQYVGIDLHRRWVGDRRDDGGRRGARHGPDRQRSGDVVAGDRGGGTASCGGPGSDHGWYWAADLLAANGARVHLAHPLGMHVRDHIEQAGEPTSPVSSPGRAGVDSLEAIAGGLVDEAAAKGIALTGDRGLLPTLVARVLETGLAAELTDHLGYEPHALEGRGSGNSRNGSFAKG